MQLWVLMHLAASQQDVLIAAICSGATGCGMCTLLSTDLFVMLNPSWACLSAILVLQAHVLWCAMLCRAVLC